MSADEADTTRMSSVVLNEQQGIIQMVSNMKDEWDDDDDKEGGLLVPIVVRIEGVDIDIDHEYEYEYESDNDNYNKKKDQKVMAWSLGILVSILFFEIIIAAADIDNILHDYILVQVQFIQDNGNNIQLSRYVLENIFISMFLAYQYRYATILLGRRSSTTTKTTTRSISTMDSVYVYYYLFLFLLIMFITLILAYNLHFSTIASKNDLYE